VQHNGWAGREAWQGSGRGAERRGEERRGEEGRGEERREELCVAEYFGTA
jgi:hypothetical protein